jgi:hypothetical protein
LFDLSDGLVGNLGLRKGSVAGCTEGIGLSSSGTENVVRSGTKRRNSSSRLLSLDATVATVATIAAVAARVA